MTLPVPVVIRGLFLELGSPLTAAEIAKRANLTPLQVANHLRLIGAVRVTRGGRGNPGTRKGSLWVEPAEFELARLVRAAGGISP